MPKRRSDDSCDGEIDDMSIPLPIQTFLWRQTSPFIRPKISRLQDAAAMEQREACKSFEKVLVQNIQFGLSPSLTEAIKSISRWRLILAALPHVMHCCAALLYGRRNSSFDKLSAAETKLLYTLHWILLDAAEECADAECEEGVIRRPEHYLLPITTIQVFIYLFAPLIPRLKGSDFLTSFRLENGYKIWSPLFANSHPDITSFTAQVKPKRNILRATRHEKKSALPKFGDVFLGVSGDKGRENTPTPSMTSSFDPQPTPTPTPTPVPTPTPGPYLGFPTGTTSSASIEKIEGKDSITPTKSSSSMDKKQFEVEAKQLSDPSMATFLDVAVLRCLFTSQWLENGIDWGLNFLLNRLKSINTDLSNKDKYRNRSSSLPLPKKDFVIQTTNEQKNKSEQIPKLVFYTDSCLPSKSPSMQDLRRSSFSGLPGMGGLTGFTSLIGSAHTAIGRTSSEKIKSPKRQKKGSTTDLNKGLDDKMGSEQNLDKMKDSEDFISNKLKQQKQRDKSESIFKSKELIPPPPRPKSAIGKYEDGKAKITGFKSLQKSEMQRGRSMPSLHLLLDRFGSGSTDAKNSNRFLVPDRKSPKKNASQTYSVPYPIITITEHSPATSIQFFLNPDGNDSPKEESIYNLFSTDCQQMGITRSQTDTNISYYTETTIEASASTNYVTKNGQLSLVVILKAVHSISLKEPVCSLKVCKSIHEILNRLINMGAIPTFIPPIEIESTGPVSPAATVSTPGGIIDGLNARNKISSENEELSIHHLFMDTLMRLIKQLGCPHGCGEGHREEDALQLKHSIVITLSYLYHSSESHFGNFFDEMVNRRNIQEIVDIFHAFLGFCAEPHNNSSSIQLSQTRKQSNTPFLSQQSMDSNAGNGVRTGYSTNFGAGFGKMGPKGIEGVIINFIFKPLITRMTKMTKEIKLQENMSLYCEIRQFITYIRDSHGGTFRKVALSGLMDSAQLLSKKDLHQTSSAMRRAEDLRSGQYSPTQPFVEETEKSSHKNKFFKKKSSSAGIKPAPSNQSISEDNPLLNEWPLPGTGLSQSHSSSGVLRVQRSASPRLSITDDDAVIIIQKEVKSGKYSKPFNFSNWFKTGKPESTSLHPESAVLLDNGGTLAFLSSSEPSTEKMVRRASFSRQTIKGGPLGGTGSGQKHSTFGKARKRMEDQFRFVFGKSKSKHGSFEETPDLSRRNSFDFDRNATDGDLILIRESKLVSLPAVRDGMIRFQFLLESCNPGTLPDPPLIAAMLDIRAPVVARAAFYLECAYFVHRCNRGLWPTWMRHNFNIFRPSGPMRAGSQSAIKGRASNVMQRAAGRAFYQWAEMLGARMEEILQNEINTEKSLPNMTDDSKRRHLRNDDEDEDFLDEAFVNPSGTECPFALKLVACQLLYEVTTFLRETHQYLPSRSSHSSIRGRGSTFEPRTVTANRRWSMALTNIGPMDGFSHQNLGERRISFVLQEADGEEESNSSVSAGDDLIPGSLEKKRLSQAGPAGRPHLLRRSTGGSGHGSFKRRSIKLKKGSDRKSASKHRSSTLVEDDDNDYQKHSILRRSDSLRSRRKVSGISERSDTSERISGDESPGVLSDDGQTPDTPSDGLEADDSEITSNIPWLRIMSTINTMMTFQCNHQQYCQSNCYRRIMRSSSRLIKAVQKVYTEETPSTQTEMVSLRLFEDKEDAAKKEKKLKKIVTGPSSPIRRKISVGHNIDKESHGHHSIHSSTTYLAHNIDIEAGVSETDDPRKAFIEVANNKALIKREENPTLKYVNLQVKNPFQAPISMLVKASLILPQSDFEELMHLSWNLVLEDDVELCAEASVALIMCALKSPKMVSELLEKELNNEDPQRRTVAINKFYKVWSNRYQFWPRLEEGAHLYLKVPPPAIEFTLPSPRIALESIPVVDPPYMPVTKSKVEEVTINQEPQIQKSFVAATKTRRKQQIELVAKALQEEEDKLREERENYRISAVPITLQAAYEPALFHTVEEHEGEDDEMERVPTHHIQAVFPSSLCSAAVTIINLLDDPQVSVDGSAVYEVAYKVIWHCLVEDSALFLRHFLERLTREKQSVIFQILRRLIRFMPRLPAQAAFTLYNYMIGFVMYHVRAPVENSQEIIATVLSILWLVVPNVHGLFLKDLKQVLRKEQCDASLLITANVPSAKKIIVHGPDASVIPSQFPIHEDTQFSQILTDSLDFFGIDESEHNEYFLVDSKTNQMHNLNAFVRDFYFFKRSQYPQISLVHMNPNQAFDKLQRQAFTLQFVELGKTLMSLSLIKSSFLGIQRVLFLHEELMKLPSFPRKALEANFSLYSGLTGEEVLGMDTLHKLVWVKLVARMFEATSGFFAQSADLHLFLNVVNGALILHCENASMLRLCMATYINAAHQFRNIFASNGYLLIIPTICRIYSNHQTNGLLCRTIEFVCKQFYILHRKPFVLQMFGAIAPILDLDLSSTFGDASKVQPRAFFQLLQSLEKYIVDPLDILELVEAEKPLKALDFCYQMDAETLTVLDAISLCVTVVSYAAETERGHQMLTVLEAILPLHLKHMQTLTTKKETPGGPRTELQMIHNVSVCMKTLIYNSEALTRNFTGPQKAIDLRGSSIKNASKGAYSPPIEIDDDSHSKYVPDNYYQSSRSRPTYQYSDTSDGELMRTEFRRPRDVLLKVVAEFLSRSTARLADLSKKLPDLHQKGSTYELLDVKCHLRLAEIAHSLLKMAPYDPPTMACRGLVRYMNEILPNSEWRQEQMRPALIMVLRRLDKTFTKIAKKSAIKRTTDWEAAKRLLKGVYLTFVKHPYIVHLPHLKSLISVCQNIVLGDQAHAQVESASTLPSWCVALSQSSPPGFTSVAVRLIALQMLQLGDTQTLETVCSGAFSSPEKSEIYLMNLIYPMCVRISSGLKEVPKLRQCDINFTLTVILNTLKPISIKTAKGSDSSAGLQQMMQNSLHQVGFLGLKIMMVCFERQLTTEWYRISKCIRELGSKMQGGITLWNFLDFVVTYRTPLFLLLFPVIKCKYLLKICDNDQEYYYQQQIKDKMMGMGLPLNRSKGQLLVTLMSEMRTLREELINRKAVTNVDERNKSIVPDQSSGDRQPEGRLSFAFTQMAASASKLSNISSSHSHTQQSGAQHGMSPDGESVQTPTSSKPSLLRGLSFRLSGNKESRLFPPRNLSVKSTREGKKTMEGFLRRTSYPDPKEPFEKELHPEAHTQAQSEPKLFRKSTLHIKKGSKKGNNSQNSSFSGPSIEALTEGVTLDDEQEIRSAISRKLSGGEGSGASRSDSPDEDRQLKHRLQRQKAQSRKTFRFRKSRRGAGFLNKDDSDTNVEEIPLTSTKQDNKDDKEVTLAEEESSSIIERSREKEDNGSSSTGLLSPKDFRNDSNESLNECSALLPNEETRTTSDTNDTILTLFPYVDEDV